MSTWDPASEVKLRDQPLESDVVQEDLLEKCTEYGEYKLMCAIHNIEEIVTREEFQAMKLEQEKRAYLDNVSTFFSSGDPEVISLFGGIDLSWL